MIAGINRGGTIGPRTALSGTIGAARTADRREVPALAVNQGVALIGGQPAVSGYTPAAKAAMKWLKEHRKALAPKKAGRGLRRQPERSDLCR